MAGAVQILASVAADVLHYPGIPSFPYSPARVYHPPIQVRGTQVAEDVIRQNKANFRAWFRLASARVTLSLSCPRNMSYISTFCITCYDRREMQLVNRECYPVLNQANFRIAKRRLIAAQEKGYGKRCRSGVCENKANLSARAGSVPVRASVETQHFASPRAGPVGACAGR